MKFTTEQVENLVQEPISSFVVDKGCNAGDSVSSDLLRIEVHTETGKIVNLVYKKLPTDQPMVMEYALSGQIFRRENYFYNTFVPNVESVLKTFLQSQLENANSSSPTKLKSEDIIAQLQLPVPKYFSGFNDDYNDYICLEDLRPSGFTMPDKTIGLNFQECSLALQKLAQFHALSYFYLRFEGENVFKEIENYKVYLKKHWAVPSDTETDTGEDQENSYIDFLQTVYRNGVALINDHCHAEDKETLVSRMAGENNSVILSAYASITSTTLKTDTKYFPLLIHGDFWMNNLLISYNANGEPTDVKLIDFQFARRGNIYEDLNYFMFTSTTAKFRTTYLFSSLSVYYESFISTLKLIGFPPPLNFTRGQFMNDFYENILPAYLFLSFALPLQVGRDSEDGTKDEEFTDELVKKMIRSPLAMRRWEEATREAVQMKVI